MSFPFFDHLMEVTRNGKAPFEAPVWCDFRETHANQCAGQGRAERNHGSHRRLRTDLRGLDIL